MGKASQSKKVARAARAAPQAKPSRRRWLWPAAVALVVVLGGVVIVQSRHQSHPAPVQQITDEDTSTTAAPGTTLPGTNSTLNAATATTAAGATATSAATATTTVSSTTTVAPATTAAP
jgi:hypothetical protein